MLSLFEVANDVRPDIKAIQNVFSKIKKRNKYNVLDAVSLSVILKKVFKCKFNVEFIAGEKNAYVLPFYKSENKNVNISNKDIPEITEIIKNTEEINLWLGIPFLKEFTSGELTAVLLHELGHVYINSLYKVYTVTSIIDNVFLKLCKKILVLFNILYTYNRTRNDPDKINIIPVYINAILFTLIYVLQLPCRFFSRKGERLADDYAVKMGYGDELISAFEKLSTIINNDIGFFKKIQMFLIDIFYLSTHPGLKDRTKYIIKKIEDEYSDRYPNMKTRFEKVFAKYNESMFNN